MSDAKLREDKFGEMLSTALQKHTEPTPVDFTAEMLKQIREAEQRRILARVILQERLALAGCIAMVIITIVIVALFPSIAESFTGQVAVLASKITKTVEVIGYEWKLYAVFAIVFGFAVYSLVDLLTGDGWL